MSYNYQALKQELFTEEGLDLFTRWRDRALELLAKAGAFMHCKTTLSCSNSQLLHACADLMVERGELVELTSKNCWGQNRVFVAGKKCPPLPEVEED